MGKRSKRRATRIGQDNDIGCTWGLIRMFYTRRDPKLILDRKQGSRRNPFTGFAGRGHSRNKSGDFDEIDETGGSYICQNMEECSSRKPAVKRPMEGELGKLKQSKKIPNDEVQRILADLGHDVCLDRSSRQNSKLKGITNHNANINIASSSGSMDSSGTKCMKQAEEDDLELALSDFFGQISRCHDEGPDDDCKNKSELCPEMKSLIHTKLNEFNNPVCDLAYEKVLVSEEKEVVDNKHLRSRHVGARLEPKKMLEETNIVEDTKTSNHCELVTKTQSKESSNIFFWKKDKSSRKHTPEKSCQPVNKIVILKPNPRRGFDPTVATTSTYLHQQSCSIQAPEYSATECSKFSIKEVRRRFRIVAGETRKGGPTVNEDDLQRGPSWLRDPVFTIKKDSRQVPPDTSANGGGINDVKPSNSRKKKQINDGLGRTNSIITASKDASSFYKEAKKHLSEILKDRSQTTRYPSPITRSLVGMLSLPQRSTSSSPGGSPRIKECIELSPEDKNICAIHKAEREESENERKKSEKDSVSVECGTSEELGEQADQRRHSKEEATQHGIELDIVRIEEIDKPDHSETISDVNCTPEQQHRYNSPLEMMEGAESAKEHPEMFLRSHENVTEKLQQEEPKTPSRSESFELIPQVPSEDYHEKEEQPSPVSVLDPFFHEDVDSPEKNRMIKCELHQDGLRTQYYPDVGSDQGIFWGDKDVRLGYIKAVLELSELCTYQNLEVWYLEEELVSACLFEELHQGNQTDDLKLFFDCICETITVIQRTYFRNPPCITFPRHNIQAPPMGQNLVSEINKHIEGLLNYQFPSTLNQLVSMDLEDGTWMNLRSEIEEIVMDIWEYLLDELTEETNFQLSSEHSFSKFTHRI
ncbi:uncharacterized protein LOC100838521 isoform X1 [Brachypodium distachyon]|uniref:uncharacterized protein LOC100838521 isoform X1 n=1 Tax=Brachypodium distachyon TaxID=15368 RepID=UPI0005300053|nr:uncharacterized protein LOC100838521 isoform X1 [Brachypodium distachyon]|eukprot:XP_010229341.1 uncharacterized protein LOC100838521 isoform X1 [Brachypodium distachyon]